MSDTGPKAEIVINGQMIFVMAPDVSPTPKAYFTPDKLADAFRVEAPENIADLKSQVKLLHEALDTL